MCSDVTCCSLAAEGLVGEESQCVALVHLSDANCALVATDTGQMIQAG